MKKLLLIALLALGSGVTLGANPANSSNTPTTTEEVCLKGCIGLSGHDYLSCYFGCKNAG